MTPPSPLTPAWFSQFSDPYAVLGVSVTADDRRILKRYHQVAKQLHPDVQSDTSADQAAFITQTLTKLVNPAYQRLKQEKQRSEVLATLRFKVRRLVREGQFHPQGEASLHLQTVPEAEVDTVYEHTLQQLSEAQYDSVDSFTTCTHQISELNLVYFQRKMGDVVIREKRVGMVKVPSHGAAPAGPGAPGQKAPTEEAPVAYSDRHYQRAREYLRAKNAPAAIQELKDALKLEPQNSNFHSLMGQAYLLNNLPGMAKVHFKQALRIDPNNSVAQKYARQLNLDLNPAAASPSASSSPSPPPSSPPPSKGLFGRLFSNTSQ
ncbi:molecular chaperone DnaJ [Leptolyngbya sp. BL0902]|uniref:J domain-containing protein n=1 Tax=Leptolyngbya sp. BL0902 TaxID=1115757 RepID=UPI0018E8B493|nr:J domain-containing protein [Leptolyngbya sp. BL0902]QQE66597.1 molecular chaperone DnaJ [Leptolyngbya sp. BL0902]